VRFRLLARRGLLALIAVLYAVSIPWYRASDATPAIWLGLPDWVAVAGICYVAVAVCNAIAWLLAEVRDDGEAPE
jgi:hypothetical protein